MKQTQQLIVLISLLTSSCSPNKQQDSIEKWKQEIVDTELAFSEMAQEDGISKAFLTNVAEYAASKGLLRQGTEIDEFNYLFIKYLTIY